MTFTQSVMSIVRISHINFPVEINLSLLPTAKLNAFGRLTAEMIEC